MPTLSSRRLPWPWDARIALSRQAEPGGEIGSFRGTSIGDMRGRLIGTLRPQGHPLGVTKGFMLLPQSDGSLLIAKKQTNLESLYPSTAEYSSAPVYRERTFMFRPTGGLGEPVQSSAGDRRYHYAINCWVTGGLFGRGPRSHTVLPTGGAGMFVRKFIEALGPGPALDRELRLFYLAGPRVYMRSDDTPSGQVVSRERAGKRPLDAVRFQGAYAGSVDGLYVSWDDGVLEEYDGTSWKPCSLPVGFNAHFLEVLGRELWAAEANIAVIRKVEGDPKLDGSWGGPIQIGIPNEKITALRQTLNRLIIFKDTGGIFTINADGSDNDLFPGIEATPDRDNARTAANWLGSLWFRMGRAFYELTMGSGPTLKPAGPGRNLSNSSEVKGPVQAWAGWNTQMAFAAIYNQELGHSYLLSYGSWLPRTEGSESGSYTFADQYDGAIVRWKNRQVTALFVSSIPGEARLYAGFADGSFDWITLVPYPLTIGSSSGVQPEYTTDESYIVTPLHHAMFQADNKHVTGVSIYGPQVHATIPGATHSVFIRYRLRGSAAGPIMSATGDFLPFGDQPMSFSAQRVDANGPIAGQAIELKIELDSNSTASTPVLEGVGLHERLVPRFRRDYNLTINANDLIARRDGSSTRQSGVNIREMMEEAAAAPASITLILPDERVNDVALFTYEERQVPHNLRGGQGWAIAVQATQFTTVDLYGIIRRLRGTKIGDLRGYTIDQLRLM